MRKRSLPGCNRKAQATIPNNFLTFRGETLQQVGVGDQKCAVGGEFDSAPKGVLVLLILRALTALVPAFRLVV